MQEAAIRQIQELRLLMGSARDPENRVFAQLADALRLHGELDEALHLAREGTEHNPHFTPGHVVLGWILQERGDLDGALEAFEQTLALDPANPFGLYGKGVVLQARGHRGADELVSEARSLLPEVARRAPTTPDAAGPLHELPFMTLSELAPDGLVPEVPTPEATLKALPFMALSALAPDPAPGPSDAGSEEEGRDDDGDEEDALPFMALSELAPSEARAEAEVEAGPEIEAQPEAEVEADVEGQAEVEGEAVPGPEPAPADDEPSGEDADATPRTRTMAELLVSQGLTDQAIRVYREMLDGGPGDDAIRARIAELEAPLDDGTVVRSPDEAVEVDAGWDGEAEADPGEEGEEADHSPFPELTSVEVTETDPTPFAWDGDADPDDGHEEEDTPARPASDYFGRLLSWSPGRQASTGDEGEAG